MTPLIFFIILGVLITAVTLSFRRLDEGSGIMFSMVSIFFVFSSLIAPVRHLSTVEYTDFKLYKTDREIIVYAGDYKFSRSDMEFFHASDKLKSVIVNCRGNVFGGLKQYTHNLTYNKE